MTRNLSHRVSLAAAFVCALMASGPVANAQSRPVSAGVASLLAWNEKEPEAAEQLSTAALRANPNDPRALLVRALLARARNQPEASFRFAKAAYTNSDLDALRFDAAILAAEALAKQGRYTRAQLWLRRADQTAPDAARRTVAERSYARLSALNPFSVKLRFGVAPSSNVNNGAETAEIEIGGLPFRLDDSGLQLGGYEAEAGLSLSYRISRDSAQTTDLLGELFYRRVWLDSDAKKLAPAVEGSDFDYGVVATGIRHSRLIWPDLGPTTVNGVIGQTWYGNEELARWGDLGITQTVRRSDTSAVRFGVSFRHEKRLDDSVNDSRSVGLNVEYRQLGGGGSRNTFGIFAKDVRSDSATVDRLAVGASAERVFERFGPIVPRIKATAETREYRQWVATPGGRRDTSLGVQLDAVWADVRYFGFSPQVVVTARRTWSDVDIYDRNEMSIGLNVISRF